jgi:hypothetical protein
VQGVLWIHPVQNIGNLPFIDIHPFFFFEIDIHPFSYIQKLVLFSSESAARLSYFCIVPSHGCIHKISLGASIYGILIFSLYGCIHAVISDQFRC